MTRRRLRDKEEVKRQETRRRLRGDQIEICLKLGMKILIEICFSLSRKTVELEDMR